MRRSKKEKKESTLRGAWEAYEQEREKKEKEKEKLEEIAKIERIIEDLKDKPISIEELLSEDSEEFEELNNLVQSTLAIKEVDEEIENKIASIEQPPPETIKTEIDKLIDKVREKGIFVTKIDDKYYPMMFEGKPDAELDEPSLYVLANVTNAFLLYTTWLSLFMHPPEKRLENAKILLEQNIKAGLETQARIYEVLIRTNFRLADALKEYGKQPLMARMAENVKVFLLEFIKKEKLPEIFDKLKQEAQRLSGSPYEWEKRLGETLMVTPFSITVKDFKILEVSIPRARFEPYAVIVRGRTGTIYEGVNYIFLADGSPTEAYGKMWWLLTRYNPVSDVFVNPSLVEEIRVHRFIYPGTFPSVNWVAELSEKSEEAKKKYYTAFFDFIYLGEEPPMGLRKFLDSTLGHDALILKVTPKEFTDRIFDQTGIVELKAVSKLLENIKKYKIMEYFVLEKISLEEKKLIDFYLVPIFVSKAIDPKISDEEKAKIILRITGELDYKLIGRILYIFDVVSKELTKSIGEIPPELYKIAKNTWNLHLQPEKEIEELGKLLKPEGDLYTNVRKIFIDIQNDLFDAETEASKHYIDTIYKSHAWMVSKLGVHKELPDDIIERIKVELTRHGFSLPEKYPDFVTPISSIDELISEIESLIQE
ncbi:MAG: hypothetical protein QXX03_05585 [Nitrososphaerota archaeon]